MSRGEIVSQLEDLGKSGDHEDVMNAAKRAIEVAEKQGADDPYEIAVSFLNAAAVVVPGTKTIWTERRLREFVDLGVKRPGL
jgi:mannose/cellobiose epimerase-like protein (N-acyl-D-glucosamine 2-epimerase family)